MKHNTISRMTIIVVAATLAGCGSRGEPNPHNIDAIYLTPEQERDIFIGQGNFGPEQSVIVLAKVPKARYESGAIVLTGGRDMEIVQPHAWREYTGTALTVEEARRLVARAERLEQNIADMAQSAAELKDYLQDRSEVARHQAKAALEDEKEREAEHVRRQVERAQALGKVQIEYDQDINKVEAGRDSVIRGLEKERDQEIEDVGRRHSERVIAISEDYGRREIALNAEYEKRTQALKKRQELDVEIAKGKASDDHVVRRVVDGYMAALANLDKEQKNAIVVMRGDRDREVAKAREEAGIRMADLRNLYSAKAQTVREDVAAKIRALHEQKSDAAAAAASARASSTTVDPAVNAGLNKTTAEPAQKEGNGK